MLIAITREVSPRIEHCELTHLSREPIDIELARAQHRLYEKCLADLGCEIRRLPPAPELPDAVFVEDAAIVLNELAVIMRPGAESRRAESESVAAALKPYRNLSFITSPGTMDGGDVLSVGKTLFVGLSQRSDMAGIEQLGELVGEQGYTVETVPMKDCLHLKSAVTVIGPGKLLINPDWVPKAAFGELELVEIDPSEPPAANALLVGDTIVYPSEYPRTRQRLQDLGHEVRIVLAAELAKAEGRLTCSSLIFKA
jgi:dimethylargininase